MTGEKIGLEVNLNFRDEGGGAVGAGRGQVAGGCRVKARCTGRSGFKLVPDALVYSRLRQMCRSSELLVMMDGHPAWLYTSLALISCIRPATCLCSNPQLGS